MFSLTDVGKAAGKGGNKPPPEPTPSNPAIAYVVSYPSTGTWGDMMAMGADGSEQTVVVPGGSTRPISPSWSPDGNSIVYAHFFNGACSGLHVVSKDSNGHWGTPQPLRTSANQCIFGFVPVWSPDDSSGENTVAFLAEAVPGGHDGVFIVKFARTSDGSFVVTEGPTLLYYVPGIHAGDATWSPNGKKLAFLLADDLLVLDMERPLDPPTSIITLGSLGSSSFWSLQWAKTKDLLVVAAGQYPQYDLWCVDANIDSPLQATNLTVHLDQQENLTDVDPSWSPDDSEIIFSRNGAAMALTIDAASGCPSATVAASATVTQIAAIKGRKSMWGFDWWRNWTPLP